MARRPGVRVSLEPVVGNSGVVIPTLAWHKLLRKLCMQYGVVLIFDEVMTGFRLARGGAQERFGITPDLSCFGKVIGGGLPVGAFGGRADVMDRIAPAGPVYQAGTLSGNPMAMAAGFATLRLMTPAAYEKLETISARLADGLAKAAAAAKVPVQVNRVGSMLTVFFSEKPVFDAASARACSTKRFAAFHHALLEGGVYFPPSQFEAAFLSTAHTQDDADLTLRAARAAFAAAAKV